VEKEEEEALAGVFIVHGQRDVLCSILLPFMQGDHHADFKS
jgi:hypothetical protein